MKKTTKIMAVLSAAGVMTAAAPLFPFHLNGSIHTVFAQATGWIEEDGELRYYDADGYYLTDSWKKNDGDWFYLNEDGYAAKNTIVEDTYYVDESGKRVYNQWVSVENDESWDEESPETLWYYFGKDGKAAMSKWQSIEEKWYYFNENGHMQTGKLELDGYTYYLGEENDGVRKTGWIQLENESEDLDADYVWHYFDNSGRMIVNQVDRKIGGEYYTFENGVMQTGWYKLPAAAQTTGADVKTATDSNASVSDTSASDTSVSDGEISIAGYQYYEADGRRASGWRTMEGAENISDDFETFTFYFKQGKPLYAQTGIQTFTVDSKKYAFNTRGEMQTGLEVVTLENGETANFYFGADGVMKTGKQTIYNEDLDENQTWFFYTDGTRKGQGYHGIRDNVIYHYGLRQEADHDLKYVPVSFGDSRYLVNTAGVIQRASSSSKSSGKPELGNGFKDITDANDVVWTVNTSGIIQ